MARAGVVVRDWAVEGKTERETCYHEPGLGTLVAEKAWCAFF